MSAPDLGFPMEQEQNAGGAPMGQQQNTNGVPMGQQQNTDDVSTDQQQNAGGVPMDQQQNAGDIPMDQQQSAGGVPMGASRRRRVLIQDGPLHGDHPSVEIDSDSLDDSVAGGVPPYSRGSPSRINQPVTSKMPQINEAVLVRETIETIEIGDEEMKHIEVAHIATRLGLLRVLRPLFNKYRSLFSKKDARGDTPLHVAARAGQISIVHYLLNPAENERTNEEIQDLRDLKNNKGNTALHEALENKYEDIARTLLGADSELVTWANEEGKTPPYLAVEAGLRDLLDEMSRLVDDSQDPIPWKGKTSLHASIITGDRESLTSVLNLKPRLIKVTDSEGRNPIHYAASIGYYDGLVELLKKNTEPAYQADNSGFYPIHMAAFNGHINIIQLLCKECPKSWSLLISDGGLNILHVAAMCNKEDVVRYILKKPEMEKLINDVDKSGNTPLHLASVGRNFKVVRVMTMDRRVNMSICNHDSWTARDIAEEDNYLTARGIAEENIVELTSFRKMLTLTALRMANAPRARKLDIFDGRHALNNYGRPATADNYKDRINTLLLASTLVATVTFAAGFTIPGDLNANVGSDLGTATMLHKTMFKVYVVCDTIALFCSIIAVISLIWAQIGNVPLVRFIIGFTWLLLGISLSMMAVAFTAGLYIVISPLHWLATAILIMTLIFLICALALLLPLRLPIWSKNCFFQIISYYFIYLLVALLEGRSDHDYIGDIEAQGGVVTLPVCGMPGPNPW